MKGTQYMLRILAGLAALALPFSAMAQEKVLTRGDARRRAHARSDLDHADIAAIHGAMVYDTLFGTTRP